MKSSVLVIAFALFCSVAFSQQKYAYVDSDYILENIPEYAAAQDKLDELSIEWQAEIEAKFKTIDSLYKKFETESVLLPEDLKTKRENDIITKEKEAKALQKKRFGTDGDLYKKRQELVKPIQDKVYNAIEELATEGSYGIIFDKSGSLTMLYTNPKLDKSDEVLEKLGYKPGTVKDDKTKE
ncbi:MAG TPA: OmpH family outer membrane protein [Bacteroidales bacterium]|nr:OmpH family outer membrane protein [Bacteroidales bacterium]HPS17992.1 OmpH family outer membrane protein [Bacteroidales bacterium]